MKYTKDYYAILGVSRTATNEEIKKTYRNLIKAFHPDYYNGDKEFATKKSAEINEAYGVLSNPKERQAFDKYLDELQKQSSKNSSNTQDSEKRYSVNLVRCPDCGKLFSKRAKSCPNCGAPNSAYVPEEMKIHTSTAYESEFLPTRSEKLREDFIISMIVLVVLAGILLCGYYVWNWNGFEYFMFMTLGAYGIIGVANSFIHDHDFSGISLMGVSLIVIIILCIIDPADNIGIPIAIIYIGYPVYYATLRPVIKLIQYFLSR